MMKFVWCFPGNFTDHWGKNYAGIMASYASSLKVVFLKFCFFDSSIEDIHLPVFLFSHKRIISHFNNLKYYSTM